MALLLRQKKPGPLKPTPNPYPSRFQRWRQSLWVTFLFILLVGVAVRLYKPLYDPFEKGLFEKITFLQKSFLRPLHETRALLQNAQHFVYLKEEHGRLSRENEVLKREVQVLRPLSHENEALRQVLQIPLSEEVKYRATRILSSPYDGLHRFFLIEGGAKEGLTKNQAVVVNEGIVGRIEKVGRHVARVLLMTDLNSRIPVMTTLSEQKAILAGNGTFLSTLVYINDVSKLQVGEKIVTSGLGGIFPPGFPVGVIESLDQGKVKVRPYAPLQTIEWVQILNIQPQEFHREVSAALEDE